MVKRSVGLLAALALVAFAVPTQADAQATIYISGGGTFPTGDYGDYADTGWMVAGGASVDVGAEGLSAGVDLFYGQNNHSDEASFFENEKTSPYGAMGFLLYSIDTGSSVSPYVFGGAGVLVHRFSADGVDSESESKFGYQFGAGLDFPVGGTTGLFVEGRYMGSEFTKFFAAMAGLAFSVGG